MNARTVKESGDFVSPGNLSLYYPSLLEKDLLFYSGRERLISVEEWSRCPPLIVDKERKGTLFLDLLSGTRKGELESSK